MSVKQDIQQLYIKNLVTLFEIDGSNIEMPTLIRFSQTPVVDSGGVLIDPVFDSNTYFAVNIVATGFEYVGNGQMPRPKLAVTNINKVLFSLMLEFDDLLGAKITRTRTLRKYLDDGSSPDPSAIFPQDIYYIEQKTKHNKYEIEFALSTPLDQERLYLPQRQVLRDHCGHIYRIYNDPSFVYTNASCPYTDTNYFTKLGIATADPAADSCGKKLSDCTLRFANEPLPIRSFPGVGRIRI